MDLLGSFSSLSELAPTALLGVQIVRPWDSIGHHGPLLQC